MMETGGNEIKKHGVLRRFLIVLLWTVGIIAGLTVATEIALTSSLATRMVNRFAAEYIDGDIRFGKVSLSLIKKFPSITLDLEDFSITYPADRFDEQEKSGPQGHLMHIGCGEEADTLASFKRFTTSIHVLPLMMGSVSIPEIELTKPRIYVHIYDDTHSNLNIFVTDTTASEDTASSFKMPKINIGDVRLNDRPRIVYTDSRDTLFTMINLRRAGFECKLSPENISNSRIGLSIDSMFVAGRLAADTIALRMDRLHIHGDDGNMDISLAAKTNVATGAFGRMQVPITMKTTLNFPEDSIPAVCVQDFKAEIAAVPFTGEADLRFHKDKTDINANLSITDCKVDDMIKKFVKNFIPEAGDIKTDAVIGFYAECNDEYIHGSGRLPVFRADITIPESTIGHKSIKEDVKVAFDAYVANTRRGSFNMTLNDMAIKTAGLNLKAYGNIKNILSADPAFSIDGSMSTSLDSLMVFLPDSMDITAKGKLKAEIHGNAKLSQMSLYKFSQSKLTGNVSAGQIKVKAPSDSLNIFINGLYIKLGPETIKSKRDTNRTYNLMGITGHIERMSASYKEALSVEGERVMISAKNSAAGIDTTKVNRLSGKLVAEKLMVKDSEGASVDLKRTNNSFSMRPKRGNPQIPVLTISSTNKTITLTSEVNRAILTDASIKADAIMNSIERIAKRNARLDSLQNVYPDIPRDSLLRHARLMRQDREGTPEWMKEEDFKKQDIDIRLDQSLAKYFREWDLNGNVGIRTGIVMTPYFPLRNILRGTSISFTNDKIAIDSLKFTTVKSYIEAKGELSGLRRALGGRNNSSAMLTLNLDIDSDKMNANELLAAYKAGTNFNPTKMKDEMATATNAEFLQMVMNDTLTQEDKTQLLVIPANLNADIKIHGNNIKYSDLLISDMNANLLAKERCVQITNTMATSNIGNVSFEGFYATRSKRDIKAGFNFEFQDITADKAINLMPSVDTLMPLLKSFAGQLNCELAATASLDTNMNILTPTINGVMRISGDDLTIKDNDMFTSLAQKLKFDNSKAGKIDNMKVEGVIKDNILEVFPFVVKLDRYTLALSGKQNFDLSYRYHASLIKSPMVIKVGVDLYGADFDNMKFKIGKPKYKNENVPVFTQVIDETRINLAESIRNIFEKGVEAAIKENEKQEAINELRDEIGYVNAVDQATEELSESEQKQLEYQTTETTEEVSSMTSQENMASQENKELIENKQ